MPCLPYMKHSALIYLLVSTWETLATRNAAVADKLRKKLMMLKADAKADPDAVAAIELKRDLQAKVCTVSDLKVVKMRVLKDIYLKKEATGDLPTMEKHLKAVKMPNMLTE